MVLPNGAADVDAAGVPLILSAHGNSATSISDLQSHDQDTVTTIFKDKYVAGGASVWSNPSGPLGQAVNGLPFGGSLMGQLTALARALLGDPTALWADFAALFTGLGAIPLQLTEHTESIANLNVIATAMNTTVAYVGDLQDMVTSPRADLVTIGAFGAKSTDILAGIGVPLSLGMSAMPIIYPTITLGASLGDIYYSPIVVDRNGTVDKIRWIAGADTSLFSINYYETALCVYNPTSHAIEKVWGSGNIKDTTANTTTLTEVEIAMGITQTCSPGQILFFAHQQTAPGLFQAARGFAAKPLGSVARPSTLLLDAACYRAPLYTQGIPSTIPLASLTRENRFIPWGAVSVDAPVLP